MAFNAAAQTTEPDLCAGALSYQADPAAVQRFRQQCTIQKLLAERADAVNRATAAEVQAAVEAAHAKAQAEALEVAKKALAEVEDYWKQYVAGLKHGK